VLAGRALRYLLFPSNRTNTRLAHSRHPNTLLRPNDSSLHHTKHTLHPQLVAHLPLIPQPANTTTQVSIGALPQALPRHGGLAVHLDRLTDARSRSPHLTIIMFYSTAALTVAALSGLVAAQSTNETGTGPTIDANSVTYATRQTWCRIQTQTCPQLCDDGRTQAGANTCDPVSDRQPLALQNSIARPNVLSRTPSPTLAFALPAA
jgi:hypothetical protein